MDFADPVDHRVKVKEMRDKYLYFAKKLKKLSNMKVTVIPIVVGALGTVQKSLVRRPEELEIGGRAKLQHC